MRSSPKVAPSMGTQVVADAEQQKLIAAYQACLAFYNNLNEFYNTNDARAGALQTLAAKLPKEVQPLFNIQLNNIKQIKNPLDSNQPMHESTLLSYSKDQLANYVERLMDNLLDNIDNEQGDANLVASMNGKGTLEKLNALLEDNKKSIAKLSPVADSKETVTEAVAAPGQYFQKLNDSFNDLCKVVNTTPLISNETKNNFTEHNEKLQRVTMLYGTQWAVTVPFYNELVMKHDKLVKKNKDGNFNTKIKAFAGLMADIQNKIKELSPAKVTPETLIQTALNNPLITQSSGMFKDTKSAIVTELQTLLGKAKKLVKPVGYAIQIEEETSVNKPSASTNTSMNYRMTPTPPSSAITNSLDEESNSSSSDDETRIKTPSDQIIASFKTNKTQGGNMLKTPSTSSLSVNVNASPRAVSPTPVTSTPITPASESASDALSPPPFLSTVNFTKLAKLEADQKFAQDAYERMKREWDPLEKAKLALETECKNQLTIISDLNKDLSAAKEEHKAEIAKLVQQHNSKVEELQNKLTELEKLLTAQKEATKAREVELKTAQGALQASQDNVQQLESEKTVLTAQATQLNGKVEELETEKNNALDQAKKLTDEVQGLRKAKGSLEVELKEVQGQLYAANAKPTPSIIAASLQAIIANYDKSKGFFRKYAPLVRGETKTIKDLRNLAAKATSGTITDEDIRHVLRNRDERSCMTRSSQLNSACAFFANGTGKRNVNSETLSATDKAINEIAVAFGRRNP